MENPHLDSHLAHDVNQEVLSLVVTYLDNETLRTLSRVPSLWSDLLPYISTQYFWYKRTEILVKRELASRTNADWKRAYYALEEALTPSPVLCMLRPLFFSVYSSSVAAGVLIELGYDPSENNYAGIRIAVQGYNPDLIQVYLDDGRFSDTILVSCLDTACGTGCVAIVRAIVAHPRCILDERVIKSLCIAARESRVEVVRYLLFEFESRESSSLDLSPALTEVTDTEIARALLSCPRVNPAYRDSLALRAACHSGSVDVVRLLLSDGRADPMSCNGSAFVLACESGSLEIVELLLADERVEPVERGLLLACRYNKPDVVKLLLKDGRIDVARTSALEDATANGCVEVVEELLRDRAERNARRTQL